jgi:hypothetical protein
MDKIADMESNGVYFTEEQRKELQRLRDEALCAYSGLPSPLSYQRNNEQILEIV